MCVGKLGVKIPEDGLVPEGHASLDEMKKLAVELVTSIKEKRTIAEQVKEQEEIRKYFGTVIEARKEQWGWEYRYWKEKGWL